jgi:hypothetical protein
LALTGFRFLQPDSVALSLRSHQDFDVLCFIIREPAIVRQNLAARSAQPVASGVNNRVAGRTVPLLRSDTDSAEQILAAAEARQGLASQPIIVPPFVQYRCTHSFYALNDTKRDDLFH